MEIKTDLDYIRRMARRRDRENMQFRTYRKDLEIDGYKIDEIVHEIYGEFHQPVVGCNR